MPMHVASAGNNDSPSLRSLCRSIGCALSVHFTSVFRYVSLSLSIIHLSVRPSVRLSILVYLAFWLDPPDSDVYTKTHE